MSWRDIIIEDRNLHRHVTIENRKTGKKSHKQNVPKTAKKWSIQKVDLPLLRFGLFRQNIERLKI